MSHLGNRYQSILSILITLVCGFSTVYAEIPYRELKGLYSIFKPEKSYLSPIHGFTWWESSYLQNLCSFGDRQDATIQLIRLLFTHSPGGFYITRQHPIALHLSPQGVGAIFRALEPYIANRIPVSDEDIKKQVKLAIVSNFMWDRFEIPALMGVRKKRAYGNTVHNYLMS